MSVKLETETLKKLQPKLRMIANGSTTVNIVRSERCAALAVDKPSLLKEIPELRGPDAAPVAIDDLPKKPKRPHLKTITPDVLANVFVYLRDTADDPQGCTGKPHSRKGQIVQVQTKVSEIPKLAKDENVAFVEIAEALKAPAPTLAELRPAAPSPSKTPVR